MSSSFNTLPSELQLNSFNYWLNDLVSIEKLDALATIRQASKNAQAFVDYTLDFWKPYLPEAEQKATFSETKEAISYFTKVARHTRSLQSGLDQHTFEIALKAMNKNEPYKTFTQQKKGFHL